MQAIQQRQMPTPFAIPISFTANYPLETCMQLLLDSQVSPPSVDTLLGDPKLKFKFLVRNMDVYEFETELILRGRPLSIHRGGRVIVIAKGNLQKQDNDVTSVTGYADTKISSHILFVFVLIEVMWLISSYVYSHTNDGLLALGVFVLLSLTVTIDYVFNMRADAKLLARFIEARLINRSANTLNP